MKVSAGRRFAKTREADIAPSLRREIPELAQIAADELQRVTASELRRSQAAVAEERPPTPDELDASAAVSAGLARSGVPMEAVNRWRRLMVRRGFGGDAAGGGGPPLPALGVGGGGAARPPPGVPAAGPPGGGRGGRPR